jgi:hypothetical protein
MTDARLPERWLNDRRFLRLSDSAYRSYFQLLLWSVSNRSDGEVDVEDIALIPTFDTQQAPALIAAGLIEDAGRALIIVDFEHTQTSRSELETLANNRKREREKKRKQRAKDRPALSEVEPPTVLRQSAQRTREEVNREPVTDWPTAQIPDAEEPF